jgi:3-hydroxyisobutyrate dehydrogenase-like beta-hydroxyacid dehydrogenase
MRIGCIGVEHRGGAWAQNLIRAGKDVLVYDRSPKALAQTLSAGDSGHGASCLADFADREILFTSLPLPEEVTDIMLGPNGLLAKLPPGTTHVDLSVMDPQTAITLETAARTSGCRFLQCSPGTFALPGQQTENTLFVGGSHAVFEELSTLWPLLCASAQYMGTVEAACAIKLISSMVAMANLTVLAEGIRIGEKVGIGRRKLIRLLQDTEARSFQMDQRGPWIANDDFATRIGLDLALKDVRLGCQMAEAWGMNIPAIMATFGVFKRANAAGLGSEDCNAVYKITK